MLAFQVKVMRALKVLTAKVEAQSNILVRLETQLNTRKATSGLSMDDAASELKKSLPLQTHAALEEFEKLIENEENKTALVSSLRFGSPCWLSAIIDHRYDTTETEPNRSLGIFIILETISDLIADI